MGIGLLRGERVAARFVWQRRGVNLSESPVGPTRGASGLSASQPSAATHVVTVHSSISSLSRPRET